MLQFPSENIDKIAEILTNDGLVALPTETVFGLATSLNSKKALAKLIKLKNREINSGKVFTLVPKSPEDIKIYAKIPALSRPLIKNHFPGPLTLILPKNPNFKHPYFDNFSEIGLRIPDFPLFKNLLPRSGPLLLTSANLRGEDPCKNYEEVLEKLPSVDAVVAAPAGNTTPSTIVRVTDKIEILRKGDIIIRV